MNVSWVYYIFMYFISWTVSYYYCKMDLNKTMFYDTICKRCCFWIQLNNTIKTVYQFCRLSCPAQWIKTGRVFFLLSCLSTRQDRCDNILLSTPVVFIVDIIRIGLWMLPNACCYKRFQLSSIIRPNAFIYSSKTVLNNHISNWSEHICSRRN
jgi:hypothetical protein